MDQVAQTGVDTQVPARPFISQVDVHQTLRGIGEYIQVHPLIVVFSRSSHAAVPIHIGIIHESLDDQIGQSIPIEIVGNGSCEKGSLPEEVKVGFGHIDIHDFGEITVYEQIILMPLDQVFQTITTEEQHGAVPRVVYPFEDILPVELDDPLALLDVLGILELHDGHTVEFIEVHWSYDHLQAQIPSFDMEVRLFGTQGLEADLTLIM
jgi:hypothetical protein